MKPIITLVRLTWTNLLGFILLLILAVVVNDPSFAQNENIGKISQELTGGATVSNAVQQNLGLIVVQTGFPGKSAGWVSCSGVLLSNNWVLTAGHCLDVIDGKMTLVTASFASGRFVADAIYKFGVSANDPEGPDIGLLRLTNPIPVNGQTTGFATQLYTGNVAGKTLSVYGNSTGNYLTAKMKVSDTSGRNILLEASSSGVTTAPGDSGGPSFITENGTLYLAGLTSTSGPPAKIASIPEHRNWILAVTRSFLASSFAPINTAVATTAAPINEIRSMPWPNQSPDTAFLDILPWAEAQRVAQKMCSNRTYLGGQFLGQQPSDDTQRIVCIGRKGGRWYDASQVEIDATGWGFKDINQVGWAQTMRAAAGICRGLDPTSPGGFFTGFMATAPGHPQQRMGVICLSSQSGQFFDAESSTLQIGQNRLLGDLNLEHWGYPQRVAAQWCDSFGFTNGGFLNGHQSANKRGIVCIGPQTLSGSFGTQTPLFLPVRIYAIDFSGTLWWLENVNANQPKGSRIWQGPKGVGTSWDSFKTVFSGTGPAIYAATETGILKWYQHQGFLNGTRKWLPPIDIDTNWHRFKRIVPSGNVVYAIQNDGKLLWYRHNGGNLWKGPKEVGTGWGTFVQVFSPGDGVIYAIQPDGALLRYQHLGFVEGEKAWKPYKQIGHGWSDFKDVFAGPDGLIYAVNKEGKLLWFRYGPKRPATSTGNPSGDSVSLEHDFPGISSNTEQWEGPVEIDSDWQVYKSVFLQFPTAPTIVH